jgi:hypothetical protein
MSEPTRQEEFDIHRGREAKLLMENPLMVEAFQNIEDVWMNAMRHGEDDKVMQARNCLRVLDLVRNELTHMLQTGTMSEQAVEERTAQEEALAEDRRLYG